MARRAREPETSAVDAVFRRFLRRHPKQRRSRSLVDAVLQAFDEKVRQNDEGSLTIEALTARAGVGVGSFYEYFSSKDAVVGTFIGRVTRANFASLARIIEEESPEHLVALVRRFAEEVAKTYMQHPQRMRLLVDGIGRLKVLHIVNRERDRFADEVMTPKAQWYLPDTDPVRLRDTMRLIADATMGALVGYTSREEPTSVETITDDLATIACSVLLARHPEAEAARAPKSE